MAVLIACLGLAACDDDNTPQYHDATTKLVLNTPPFATSTYELTPGGMMDFTVAEQPDYGFLAAVNYGIEVSFDKTNTVAIAPEKLTTQTLQIKEQLVAQAMLQLEGIEDADAWAASSMSQGPVTLYVRATCQIPDVESSFVTSEWVTLENVKAYFAVREPGSIYIIGNVSGEWIEPAAGNAERLSAWRLFESKTAIGSKIYSAVFNLPADPYFRFYTDLTGWDGGASMGPLENEDNLSVDLAANGGQWEGSLYKSKANFHLEGFTGGEVTIVVNLSDAKNPTCQIMAGSQTVIDPKYIYLVGQPVGWNAPIESNKDQLLALVDKTDSGIYTATVEVESAIDWFNFRFAKALLPDDAPNQWGAEWIGCPEGDNFEVNMPFTGPSDGSENTWRIMNAQVGQKIKFVVDTSVEPATVSFSVTE
ncbi:MAG: hypothetical protein K2K55_02395 [Duncaniella sp.]|nr:hypothetical protein [Duncaniella sp.]